MSKKNNKEKKVEGARTIQNRRAGYDYELGDRYEAGLVLIGSEVKSIFVGNANLTDAHCEVRSGEAWLINMEVQPYTHSSVFTPEPRRDRKLLLHRREILQLQRQGQEKGMTLVPTKLYFKHGKVKVEIALGKGRKLYDKRTQLTEKDERRERQRGLADY